MLHLRSLAFNVFFYLWTAFLLLVLIPVMLLPGSRAILAIGLLWGRGNLWALDVICGMKVEWRGMEKIPDGPILVAAKHQSAWETFAFFVPFRRPAYVYKRQLAYVPLFGWAVWKARQIPVDRGRKGEALASITTGAKAALYDVEGAVRQVTAISCAGSAVRFRMIRSGCSVGGTTGRSEA